MNMMNIIRRHRETSALHHEVSKKLKDSGHVCMLQDATSWYTGRSRKWWPGRCISVSAKNPKARPFFLTKNEVLMERKRHMESKYFYIIHPFSLFSLFWSIIITIGYIISLVVIPLAILIDMMRDGCYFNWTRIVVVIVDAIGIFEVIRRLFTGIGDCETKTVELNQRKIIINYLKTLQCFLDIITCIPIYLLCGMLQGYEYAWRTLILCCMVKVLRVRRILMILADSIQVGYINAPRYNLAVYAVTVMFWIHWTACLLPTMPLFFAKTTNTPVSNTSWVVKEKLNLNSFGDIYLNSFFWATSIFLCVRHTSEEFEEPDEVTMLLICYICGYIGCAVFFVFILQVVLTFRAQSLNYEALTNQLCKYMSYRQLSIGLQEKMLAYYATKFKSTYFKETALMSVLSDQLRKEISLFRYVNLVKSVNILHHISDDAVCEIVSNLKMELFLPNDVIMKAGTDGDCMYFLAAGTVAIYTPMGKEICHLTDGSYFGEIELIKKDNKRLSSAIAIEICEIYRLERKEFKRSMANEPETYRYLERVALDRATNAVFMEELHKKHILEKNMAVSYNN